MSAKLTSKMEKLVLKDRDAIIRLLDLTDEDIQKIKEMKLPELKTKKNGKPRKISGYILYVNEFRNNFVHPEGEKILGKEIMSQAAAKWKSMTDEDKEVYIAQSKKSYDDMMEKYESEHSDESSVESSSEKKAKKAKKAKIEKIKIPRKIGAYQLFISDFVKKHADMEDKKAKAKEAWDSMNDEEKEPFVEKSVETAKERDSFQGFAKSIRDQSLADGIPDEKKELLLHAAKLWHEQKIVTVDEEASSSVDNDDEASSSVEDEEP